MQEIPRTDPPAGSKDDALSLVRINQTGYLPQALKRATIPLADTVPVPWTLYDQTGTAVLSGTTTVHGQNKASDEHVHVADFPAHNRPGAGFTLLVGSASSHSFDISSDLYAQLKYDAMACFYHNRGGIVLTMPYAGEQQWARPAGHSNVAPNQGDENVPCFDQVDPDYYTAVVTAINAGVDMNIVPFDAARFINTLTVAVEAGDVSPQRIDDAVRQILKVKFEMGLFEHPYSDPALLQSVGSEEHRAVAREAVAQSQVPLKNDGDMLPLAKDLPALYVAGAAADDIGIQSGGWTIEWQGKAGDITPGTTILEAVQNSVSPQTAVVYHKNAQFGADLPVEEPIVCLGVVGETPYAEGIGDSATLTLPANELQTLSRLVDLCDQLAVILLSGRPLIIAGHIENWDALVAAWLPGTEGQGVADVLFGDKPFTGKSAYTWPLSVDQLPLDFANLSAEDTLFPFGYGLQAP